MVIYEVNLSIGLDIYNEYMTWLKKHVEDIVSYDGFYEYKIYSDNEKGSDKKKIIVHYKVSSLSKLQDYFSNHAAQTRQEAIERFGNKFSATRRVLEPQEPQE